MLEENLLQLGFTHNKVVVYISLLKLGQTKVGPLLHKTGFHRNIVYRELNDLIEKKLVNVINKKGVNYYTAIDPEPLLFEQKKKEETARNVLQEIKGLQKQSYSEVMVLAGRQGILDLCEMVLKEKADVYVIGGTFNIIKELGPELIKFQERATQKNIKQFTLAQALSEKENFNLLKTDKLRYLPKDFTPSPHVIWVFGKVVVHVLWEEPQTIFIIKNEKLADNYRGYFKLLWNKAE